MDLFNFVMLPVMSDLSQARTSAKGREGLSIEKLTEHLN